MLPAAREGRGRHHRARAARERPALGQVRRDTTFAADDHRTYNRHGEAFDVGETFSGVPTRSASAAAQEIAALAPDGATTAAFALRWIVDQPGVSVVIPGARNAEQARATPRPPSCRR